MVTQPDTKDERKDGLYSPVPKVMVLILTGSLALCILFSVLYNQSGRGWILSCAITFGVIFPEKEDLKMPQIFKVGSYLIYFWGNENMPLEPIHVHISEGLPTSSATKVWITKTGNCVLANNLNIVQVGRMRM